VLRLQSEEISNGGGVLCGNYADSQIPVKGNRIGVIVPVCQDCSEKAKKQPNNGLYLTGLQRAQNEGGLPDSPTVWHSLVNQEV